MRVPLPFPALTTSSKSSTALAFGSGGMEVPTLPSIHLPDLPQGSQRLYLCNIFSSSRNYEGNLCNIMNESWNVADCLSQIPLDVVASSHLEDAEEAADVIHRSTSSSTRAPPTRIVSPRLSTSDRYLTGLQQILRDFDHAHHLCVVQHEDLLHATTLWQELCVLEDAQSVALQAGACCRIHVLDHQSCNITGDKWTLQMFNFCCAQNEWQ